MGQMIRSATMPLLPHRPVTAVTEVLSAKPRAGVQLSNPVAASTNPRRAAVLGFGLNTQPLPPMSQGTNRGRMVSEPAAKPTASGSSSQQLTTRLPPSVDRSTGHDALSKTPASSSSANLAKPQQSSSAGTLPRPHSNSTLRRDQVPPSCLRSHSPAAPKRNEAGSFGVAPTQSTLSSSLPRLSDNNNSLHGTRSQVTFADSLVSQKN